MSIIKVARELAGVVPDLHALQMKYEDGGKTEVWSTPSKTVRVKAGSSEAEIRAAFEAIAHA